MAKNIKVSVDECKEILDEFFKMFPAIKDFTAGNERLAKENGYVEDYMGRRRHLPDAQLPLMNIEAHRKEIVEDVFFDKITENGFIEVPDEELTKQWYKFLEEASSKNFGFKAKEKFKEQARASGISIRDNGAFISKTMTQCTNARIQGSASSLTKKAMVKIFNDPELNRLGFRLLVPVHDELMGECPVENAELVAKRLPEVMIEAGKPECSVNMKCDVYCLRTWYTDELENALHEKYTSMIKGNEKKGILPISSEEALDKLRKEHSELSEDTLIAMCNAEFDHLYGEL